MIKFTSNTAYILSLHVVWCAPLSWSVLCLCKGLLAVYVNIDTKLLQTAGMSVLKEVTKQGVAFIVRPGYRFFLIVCGIKWSTLSLYSTNRYYIVGNWGRALTKNWTWVIVCCQTFDVVIKLWIMIYVSFKYQYI